jgi:hypothetical protein
VRYTLEGTTVDASLYNGIITAENIAGADSS